MTVEDPVEVGRVMAGGGASPCSEVRGGRLVEAKLPSVLPDDTLIEIAAVMVAAHTPLIIVRDREKNYSGAVLLSRMLAAVASAAGEDSELMRKRLHRDLIPNAAAEGDLIPNAAAEGDRQPNAGADSDPRS